jgi:hypothetical protein
MAAVALPFFRVFGVAGAGEGATSADSASTFVRLVRRRDGASIAPAACSGLGSRATAFRFFEDVGGGGGAGGFVVCGLVVELDEPAESLAAERVTLEDMRKWLWQRVVEGMKKQRGCCWN